MQCARDPIRKLIGQTLVAYYDGTVYAPLPKRWLELIERLKDEDQSKREAPRHQGVLTVSTARNRQ